MDRESARRYVNSRPITDYVQLEKSRSGMFCCPICGSGHGPNGSGALKVFPEEGRVMCYSNRLGGCILNGDGRGQDNLAALRAIWNCGENEVFERLGIDIDGNITTKPKNQLQKSTTKKQLTDHTEFYRQAHADLMASPEALAYLHGRGITDETINQFNLGYVANWTHPATKGYYHTKRIIIPRSAYTYTARAIDPSEPQYSDDFKKQIVGTQKELFNLAAAKDSEIVFVVEGELDAISITQATGVPAIGIGSITNEPVFVENARKMPLTTVYLISLDNDEPKEDGSNPGRDTQEKLIADLTENGIRCISVSSAMYGNSGCKDANELLVTDVDALRRTVEWYKREARKVIDEAKTDRLIELARRTGVGMMNEFMQKVESRDFEPIPTGLHDIDRALDGGFVRKTIVMLAASPGAGKTNISQQILEEIATAGGSVLYINLEMSREQLLARSLSRICHKNGYDMKPLDILRGYGWTDRQRDAVHEAGMSYLDTVGDNLVYNPDEVTANLDQVIEVMESEADRMEADGRPAPVVCIDYLQLLQGKDREDDVATMKRAVDELKSYAIRRNTVVYVIVATNREANKSGQINQWSGRDTSAIEYSADVMLALTYTVIEENRKIRNLDGEEVTATLKVIEDLKRDAYYRGTMPPNECNLITMKVLKNRFGEPGRAARLYFDGANSTFYQVDATHSSWI